MPLASRSSATSPFTDCDRMVEAACDRGIGGGGADIGDRLGLGERDLALGGLGAPRHEVFHLGLGLGGDALGFRPGTGDDFLGLAFGAGAAGLVVRQHLGRLVLEAAGVVEFGLDALAAVIERRQHGLCTPT